MNREREHPIDKFEKFLLKTKTGTKIRDKFVTKLKNKIIDKEIKKYVQRIK